MAYSTNDNEISGIISPLIFVGVLSYGVASIFTEIFGMGIETILLCYIADEEMFAPDQRFADGSLKNSLQKAAERAAANAKKVNSIQVETYNARPITCYEKQWFDIVVYVSNLYIYAL